MIIPSELLCRICQQVLCCSNCRIVHEKKNHGKVILPNLSYVSVNPYYVSLCSEVQVSLLSHFVEHFNLQCFKCLKNSFMVNDINTKYFISNINFISCKFCNVSSNQFNQSNILSTSLVPIKVQEKQVAENLFRTTSTPMNDGFTLYGLGNFSFVRQFNNQNGSVVLSEDSFKLSSNSAKGTKTSMSRICRDDPEKQLKAALRQKIDSSFKAVEKSFSTNTLPIQVESGENCECTKTTEIGNFVGDNPICLIHIKKYTKESKFIKLKPIQTPFSNISQQSYDNYKSFSYLQIERSRSTSNISKNEFLNEGETTPKASGIGILRKGNSFNFLLENSETTQNEHFHTPMLSLIGTHSFKESHKKPNIGDKIWNIFSSVIQFPLINKQYKKALSKVNFFKAKHQEDSPIHRQNVENFMAQTSAKRKRSTSEMQCNDNGAKRTKFITSRQPLQSYYQRVAKSNLLKNEKVHHVP